MDKNTFSWQKLKKPFTVLAPMEDVTDTVFRQIVVSCAKPEVMVTEFMNCDGFLSTGREKVAQRLVYTENERPLIAQIWGIHPESFYRTARELVNLGFDGVDINMGCPQKKIVKTGGAGALIRTPALAADIVLATRKGMDDAGGTSVPLSVKTRIGYKKPETQAWIGHLLGLPIDALTVHGRTVAEQSAVPAHWEEIADAVAVRNERKSGTVIIGNGDVTDRSDGTVTCRTYGCDGVMIGRGIFHNPWAFSRDQSSHTLAQSLGVCLQHLDLYDQTWGSSKPFNIMKKFFKMYVQRFPDAADVRLALMATASVGEARTIITALLAQTQA